MSLLAVLVVPGLILYFMTPEERLRLWAGVKKILRIVRAYVVTTRFGTDHPFYAALRTRRRWPVVTYALAVANVGVMVAMILGPESLGSPEMLLAWGGSFGPETTAAERWRVFTSIFLHRGVIHLFVNVVVLVQLGLILERMVGPFTFATIYGASGVLTIIISTAAAPMGIFVGAGGAIFGLYGLLLVVVFRGAVQSTAIRVPFAVMRTLAPSAAIFGLYYLASGDSSLIAKVGLSTGFVSGIVLTRSVADERVRLRRFAGLGVATAGIVMMSAMGLRAITDVRPAIAEIIVTEERTSTEYDAAVRQFTKGLIGTRTLTQMIDATILPRVQQSSERFDKIADVPAEHAALVTGAQTYLRLRHDSWRARADALRKANMRHLRDADEKERAALQAFARLRNAAAAQ